jgi:hypothetical protein
MFPWRAEAMRACGGLLSSTRSCHVHLSSAEWRSAFSIYCPRQNEFRRTCCELPRTINIEQRTHVTAGLVKYSMVFFATKNSDWANNVYIATTLLTHEVHILWSAPVGYQTVWNVKCCFLPWDWCLVEGLNVGCWVWGSVFNRRICENPETMGIPRLV